MTELVFHATPYDITARGFYFKDADDFERKYKKHLPVEEYSIEFIDGEPEDYALFDTLGITQATLEKFLDEVVLLDDHDKAALYYIKAYVDPRMPLEDALLLVEDEVRVREGDAKDYAYEYVEAIGGVSELRPILERYFDYEAFGRDLATEFEFAGETFATDYSG